MAYFNLDCNMMMMMMMMSWWWWFYGTSLLIYKFVYLLCLLCVSRTQAYLWFVDVPCAGDLLVYDFVLKTTVEWIIFIINVTKWCVCTNVVDYGFNNALIALRLIIRGFLSIAPPSTNVTSYEVSIRTADRMNNSFAIRTARDTVRLVRRVSSIVSFCSALLKLPGPVENNFWAMALRQ